MDDNNLPGSPGPDVTSPQTFDSSVEDITKLLSDDPTPDPVRQSEEPEAAPAEPEDDDPLGLNVEAEDVEADAADEDDGPEVKGGRFAPDSAKVTLDDGTVTTIADLKRNNLFQRDYTRKTTELKAEREAFDTERQRVSEEAQSLSQFRDYMAWYAESYLPKAPGDPPDPSVDPHGYQLWQHKRDTYNNHVQAYQTAMQQRQFEDQQRGEETQAQMRQRLQREHDALLKAMPVLKDPVKGKATMEAIRNGAHEQYGFTSEEVDTIGDHRMLVALRDALAYRRLKSKAPEVQTELARRPVKEGRRAPANQNAQRERQARSERFRQSGSVDDAVSILANLNI